MVSSVPPALGPEGEARAKGGLRDYFGNIYRAVTTIFEGFTVTKSWMFRQPSTVQYPDKIERPVQETLPSSYRGILEVDIELCTGCSQCSKVCPIETIKIDVEKNAETKQREIKRFDIDIGRCMFCGLCVETCKFGALVHTTEFEGTVPTAEDLVLKFVKSPVPVAKFKPGQAPERHHPGTILPLVLPRYGRREPVFEPGPRPEAAPVEEPARKPSEEEPEEKVGRMAKASGEEPSS